jgi:hypothetical protein
VTHLYVEHEFKPVGQGLFAFGSLEMLHTARSRRRIVIPGQTPEWKFHWVYDCGSSSGQALVNRGIQDISSKLNGKSLDLIVISHLHFDHISGLLELLKKVHVKSIMLPWAPLWQRLLIGFEQGLQAGDAELGFYADPVGYIAGAAPDRFQRIFFVLPSSGGDRTDPDEPFPSIDPDDPELDRREGMKSAPTALPDKLEIPDTPENHHYTEAFESGDRLVKGGAWEFVPYNDPKSAPKSPETFKKSVNELRSALFGQDEVEREKALEKLKGLYRHGLASCDVTILRPRGNGRFLTSDFPSIILGYYENKFAQRFLPISPKLGIIFHTQTSMEKRDGAHHRFVDIGEKRVQAINDEIIRAAENLLFSTHKYPWLRNKVKQFRKFRAENVTERIGPMIYSQQRTVEIE